MNKIFSSLFKGIIYICTLPLTLGVLAIYSVVGVFMFFFVGIKGLILFFSGRNIFGDLPEDIEAKRRLNAIKMERQAETNPTPPTPTVVEVVSPAPEITEDHNPYITTPAPEATPIDNSPSDFIDFEEHKEIETVIPDSTPLIEETKSEANDFEEPTFLDDNFDHNSIPEEQPILEEPEEEKEEIIGTYKPLGTFNDDEYDGKDGK